jgi:hypothetical protein
MEGMCSSETSVATQQTTRCHIPEDDTLYNHRCENLKSYMEHRLLGSATTTVLSLANVDLCAVSTDSFVNREIRNCRWAFKNKYGVHNNGYKRKTADT